MKSLISFSCLLFVFVLHAPITLITTSQPDVQILAIGEKVVQSMNSLSDDLVNKNKDEELAQLLADNYCFLAMEEDIEGVRQVREYLRSKKIRDDKGKIVNSGFTAAQRLCQDLVQHDDTGNAEYEYQTSTVRNLATRILSACWGEAGNEEQFLKYTRVMRFKFTDKFHNLIKIAVNKMPEVFECDENPAYMVGNAYLNIFEKNLFSLADYLLNIQEDENNITKINQMITAEEKAQLEKIICLRIKYGKIKHKDRLINYYRKLFPDEKCN